MAATGTRVKQAPGWWPSLVQAVCDDCGWQGQVVNLASEENSWGRLERQVRAEADGHVCGEEG